MNENLIRKYEEMETPILTLQICNVCAIANLRCHLNLSHIAQNGIDVEYDSYLNVLKTKLRQPKVGLAQFWSNGKMSVFGCDTIDNARKGCRILARRIKKLGYNAKFENFQVVNILTKLQLPFKLRIHEMVTCDPIRFMYEPELDPNLYFYPNPKNRGRKFNEYRAMAKITSNGKVTIHSMTMEEAATIGNKVYKLSLKYIMEEIIDPFTQIDLVVSDNNNSCQQKARKRVVVKTYVEEVESSPSCSIDIVNLTPDNHHNNDNNNGTSTLSLSHDIVNGVQSETTATTSSYHNLFSTSFSSSSSYNNNYTHVNNNKIITELSLLEAQQVLDDLLN